MHTIWETKPLGISAAPIESAARIGPILVAKVGGEEDSVSRWERVASEGDGCAGL